MFRFLLNAEAASGRESEWDKETDEVTVDWSVQACIQACSTKCSLFQYEYYRDSRYRNYAQRRRVM